MDQSNVKWLFIAMGVALAVPSIGSAVTTYGEHMAKRDIIVACYQSGKVDCDKIWKEK